VLDEIARLEELEADPEALEAELDRLRHMMEPDDEQVQEMLASPEIRQSVARDLTMAKVQELVIQIGKGEIGAKDEAKLEAQPEAATEAEGEAELETDVEVEVAPSGEAQAEIEAEASAEMAKGETGDEPEAEGAE
jgi:FKBP-type peptidyl-prolyl cis-trans isomerase (trigger factor)